MSRLNVNQIYNLSGSVPTITTPHFRVIRTINQTLSSGTTASVQWNSVVYDPNNWFDTVNYAWKPQIAGYYWLSTILHVSGTSPTRRIINMAITGDEDIRVFDDNDSSSINIRTGGGMAYFNGTTDTASVSVTLTATNPIITGAPDGSYARFEGFLVRAA
jgi:hypothetical protein